MRASSVSILGIAVLLLTACGGGFGSPQKRSDYASTGSADADSASPSHARAEGSSRSHRVRDRRPGLGTRWGENVRSNVQETVFERASSSPFAAIALHYNDADGVDAQADYNGGAKAIYARTPYGGLAISLTAPGGGVLPGVKAGDKTLVIGRAGERYNLVIENETGGRYEIVATVDGLDVIDGKGGDLRKRGYILDPYDTLVIDGFRRSSSTVAAFRFGAVEESYAARTSGDRNVGVIGVAFFAERDSPWTTDEIRRRETADPFPGDRSYARPPR